MITQYEGRCFSSEFPQSRGQNLFGKHLQSYTTPGYSEVHSTVFPERTSLPVFLIFSRRSSYEMVPVTSTDCFGRLTSKLATSSAVLSFSRTRVMAPEQPAQVILTSNWYVLRGAEIDAGVGAGGGGGLGMVDMLWRQINRIQMIT